MTVEPPDLAEDGWNAEQYGRFADHRFKPAADLIAALPDGNPRKIVDLGCGPGAVTMMLAERWPGADVVGIDGSDDMLATARQNDTAGRVIWRQGDIGDWHPTGEDLVFSNAALHWLGDHDVHLKSWLAAMRTGAVLAVQMPNNFREPSHAIMRDVAGDPRWRDRLFAIADRMPVASAAEYRAWLTPACARVDVWETIYEQMLSGEDPVLEWLKGAGMRPYLSALHEDEREEFEARCQSALAEAYPASADGTTVFPFKRLFVVAEK